MTLKINKTLAIITGVWACVIFLFTLQPGDMSGDLSGGLMSWLLGLLGIDSLSEPQMELLHTIIRKCAHFTEYCILGILSACTLAQNTNKKCISISLIFCAIVASIDESIQLFVPDRAGRVLDALIDCSGAAVGIVLVYMAMMLINRRKK